MRAKISLVLGASVMLAACSASSELHSDRGAELAGHPLYTAGDAFVIDEDPTFLHPRVTASLHFTSAPGVWSVHGRDCIPASIAEYQANLHHWEERSRLACGGEKLIPLPAGTALQIDTLDHSWDPENGTQYYITARLLDTRLSQHEIYLLTSYFVTPRDNAPLRLNPAYFSAQPPARP